MSPEIDSIRTIYWFNFLYRSLRAKSALGVQREIDPDSIQKHDGKEISHSSKWAEYRRGKHAPREKIIEKSEERVPGSAAVFHHPLWTVLDSGPISKGAVDLIKHLDANLQPLFFDLRGGLIHDANGHFLGKLERRASIDTLAALTILMRLNQEQGNIERVWEYAHSVYRVLLIAGKSLKDHGVALQVFKHYSREIFPTVRWNGLSFYTESYQSLLVFSLALFDSMAAIADQSLKLLTPYEQNRVMLAIMNGNYASQLKRLFSPLIGPDLNLGPPNPIALENLKQEIKRRMSGIIKNLP